METEKTKELNYKALKLLKKYSDGLTRHIQTGDDLFSCMTELYLAMNMNELEFTLWTIILENCLLAEIKTKLLKLIRYSACSAKMLSNTDLGILEAELEFKFPGFIKDFRRWFAKHRDLCIATPQEINKKYQTLCSSMHYESADYYINYSKIVEELVNNWMRGKEEPLSQKLDPTDS